MKKSRAAVGIFVAGALALSACAHADKDRLAGGSAQARVDSAIDLEKTLEGAFDDVRENDEGQKRAHEKLTQAFTLYDDLHEDEKKGLVQSDADKAYRAWPHERVLASSLLAALDAKAGRCALALPVVKDALRWDGFWHQSGHADTALPALIGIYCASELSRAQSATASQFSSYRGEIAFYETQLENALIASALNDAGDKDTLSDEVLRAAHQSAMQLAAEAKQGLRLVFSGRGERQLNVHQGVDADALSVDVFVAGKEKSENTTIDDEAPFIFPLWSAGEQKRHTRVRRFERTLKVRELIRMPLDVAAALLLPAEVNNVNQLAQRGASEGLKTGAKLIDTRRDQRKIESIFAQVWWRSNLAIEVPAARRVLENKEVRKAFEIDKKAADKAPSSEKTGARASAPNQMGSVGIVEGS